MSNTCDFTVLTATYNAADKVRNLAESLRCQSDKNFTWMVIDGNSTDDTVEIIKSYDRIILTNVFVGSDAGIYDALNKGVSLISNGYYLVVGADDTLDHNAIVKFKNAIQLSGADIIAASYYKDGIIIHPKSNLGWLFGMDGIASSHSVGMAINVNLHSTYGIYSNKFPIAADQYFVKRAIYGGASINRCKFIAGSFNTTGQSSTNHYALLTDFFRVQIITEKFIFPQVLLFFIRIFKRYLKDLLN